MIKSFGVDARERVKSHYQIQKERPDFGGSILTPCRAIYNYVEYEEVLATNVAEQLEDNRMKHERGEKSLLVMMFIIVLT